MIKAKAARKLPGIALLLVLIAACLVPSSTIYAAAPVITTGTADDPTETSVILNGTIVEFGTIAGPYVYLSFDYCTEDYYTISGGQYNKRTSEITWAIANGITTFTSTLTGLSNGTTYHYRAALRYNTTFVYGADASFTSIMIAPDDTPTISSFHAYKDLIEDDDCLFVILANIPYLATPGIPVSRAFTWSLIDGSDEVGWNVGYAMNDNGYGLNLYSLYFPAAEAIDWGNVTDYYLQLSGSPAIFTAPPVYNNADSGDYAVSAETWVTTSNYNTKLATDLVAIARTLEQDWQIVLLDEQDTKTVLSSNGEKLFRNAIAGIQTMTPKLFFVQAATADLSTRTWGTSQTDKYKTRLAGVDGIMGTADDNWIAGSIQGLADWINVPFLLMVGLLCLGLCVFVIWKSNQKFGISMPGYVGSLIIILCFSLLVMGLTVIALIGMALVVMAGWLLFMRRA